MDNCVYSFTFFNHTLPFPKSLFTKRMLEDISGLDKSYIIHYVIVVVIPRCLQCFWTLNHSISIYNSV